MRINELFEGNLFKDKDFVSPKEGGGREINYDIVDDLTHFMHHDDHAYRRHLYPIIARFLDLRERKITPKASIFKPAAEQCYEVYTKKFPIRELPDNIDKELCEKVCNKLHEEILDHIADGKYKD